mgnify:CR=1 FL=1
MESRGLRWPPPIFLSNVVKAMADMFAGLSRRPMPETYNHLDEIIADLQEGGSHK